MALVCDYGSGFSKVGFSGSEFPRAMFPTVLGTPLHKSLFQEENAKELFIGEETLENRRQLQLHHPILRATVLNWSNMEKVGAASAGVWHHSFYQVLHISPEQYPLLITDPPLSTIKQKENILQILFEEFRVPGLYLANQAVLSLFASGQVSGTTIECGEGLTYCVPIVEGYSLQHSTLKMEVAGQDLTLYLMKLLAESGNTLVRKVGKDSIQDMKEKYCYVASKFDRDEEKTKVNTNTQTYHLPDGQEIILGSERFLCPEILFQPDLIGINSPGIHMMAFKSMNSCNPQHWDTLFGNILLTGGTGSCAGLQIRLQKEISKLAVPSMSVKVSSCPYSNCSAWIGGSILSSLSTFKDMWIMHNDYKDVGSSIIRRRSP
ncbi:actin-like [Sorex araneus]|uniref:actin-like n=1 Tax=Sorex araneus TaxID=42254 RepID=UPI0024339E7C|nr:actin-like [Sorex araneus]